MEEVLVENMFSQFWEILEQLNESPGGYRVLVGGDSRLG